MKPLLFFASLLVAATVSAQRKFDKTPYLTQSFSADAVKTVAAQTSAGSIEVTGGDVDPRIEVYVRPGNGNDDLTDAELKQRLDANYDLSVAVADGRLTATAKAKPGFRVWKKSVSVSYRIYVAPSTATELTTSGGSISLQRLTGKHEFRTSGGSLHVTDVGGTVRGATSGGSLHLDNVRDDVQMTTSGGSIEAKNCTGRLNLATSGGSLSLHNLNGTVEATTSGGSVSASNIRGELKTSTSGGSVNLKDLACSLETSTSGGQMAVSFTSLGSYVRIRNSGGGVDLELPRGKGVDLQLSGRRISTTGLESFSGRSEENEMTGRLGDGGVPVKVEAHSGSIRLTVR